MERVNKIKADAYLIKNVIVVQPESSYFEQKVDIYVANNKIVSIDPVVEPKSAITSSVQDTLSIDLEGAYVSVGWVDAGAELQYPGVDWREDTNSFCNAALRGGLTDVVVFPQGAIQADDSSGLASLSLGKGRPRIYPVAALTANGAGKVMAELGELSDAGAIAFGDYKQYATDSSLFIRLMQYLNTAQQLCIQYPQEAGLYADAVVNESPSTTHTGLKLQPSLLEVLAVERLAKITQYTGGRLAILPVSAADALEVIIRYQQLGVSIFSISTPAYLCLDDSVVASFDTNYKLFPPLRSASDKQLLAQALFTGKLNAVASLHSPRTLEEKQLEFDKAYPGMIGLETLAPLVYEVLAAQAISSSLILKRFIEIMTVQNRQLYGLSLPTIEIGSTACFTVFDTLGTKPYLPEHSASKCKNSAMFGRIFQLQVRMVCLENCIFNQYF